LPSLRDSVRMIEESHGYL